jgi:hypothetical protein
MENHLTKNQSKKQLNTNNTRSKDQFSDFVNLKNQGFVNINQQSEAKKTSKSPALKLKDKLSDQFDHFIRKHRFSAIMTGNELLEGKNANFYINLKKKENEHEQLLNETLKNSNTNKSINENLFNESFGENESKGINKYKY